MWSIGNKTTCFKEVTTSSTEQQSCIFMLMVFNGTKNTVQSDSAPSNKCSLMI